MPAHFNFGIKICLHSTQDFFVALRKVVGCRVGETVNAEPCMQSNKAQFFKIVAAKLPYPGKQAFTLKFRKINCAFKTSPKTLIIQGHSSRCPAVNLCATSSALSTAVAVTLAAAINSYTDVIITRPSKCSSTS